MLIPTKIFTTFIPGKAYSSLHFESETKWSIWSRSMKAIRVFSVQGYIPATFIHKKYARISTRCFNAAMECVSSADWFYPFSAQSTESECFTSCCTGYSWLRWKQINMKYEINWKMVNGLTIGNESDHERKQNRSNCSLTNYSCWLCRHLINHSIFIWSDVYACFIDSTPFTFNILGCQQNKRITTEQTEASSNHISLCLPWIQNSLQIE